MIVPLPPTNAVAFVDARHGWVGGEGGLLGTSDGETFRIETRAPIIDISAFDRARAWALTGDGLVLRTADGRHWSRLGAPHLFRMQFVDARVGFALTRDGVLVVSGDSGRSWVEARSPGLVQSECFVSRRDGWVARGGSVWSTHDGGRRWVRVRLRNGPQELPELGCGGADVWVVFHEGAAAGTEAYFVYRSLGGGRWRAVFAPPFQKHLPSIGHYTGPFDVLGRRAAVFTGSCAACADFGTGEVARTLDGGATLNRFVFSGYTPKAVSFSDTRNGWLVTGQHVAAASPARLGLLWRSRDGGRTWRVVFRSPLLAP